MPVPMAGVKCLTLEAVHVGGQSATCPTWDGPDYQAAAKLRVRSSGVQLDTHRVGPLRLPATW